MRNHRRRHTKSKRNGYRENAKKIIGIEAEKIMKHIRREWLNHRESMKLSARESGGEWLNGVIMTKLIAHYSNISVSLSRQKCSKIAAKWHVLRERE